MNHTQRILIERAREIRAEERENATWGGPDPRGRGFAIERLKMADEFDAIAAKEATE